MKKDILLLAFIIGCLQNKLIAQCDSIIPAAKYEGDTAISPLVKSFYEGSTTYYDRYYERAKICYQRKQYSEAIRWFDSAMKCSISRKADNVTLLDHRGTKCDYLRFKAFSFDSLKNYTKAIYFYSETFEACDHINTDLFFRRANIKFLLNDYRGAIRDYKVIIDLKDHDDQFNNPFTKSWSSSMSNSYLYSCNYNMALCFYNINKFSEASNAFEEAIIHAKFYKGNDDKLSLLHYYLGMSYLKLNQKEEACVQFSISGEKGHAEAYKIIRKHCK